MGIINGTDDCMLKPVSADDMDSMRMLVDIVMSAHGLALESSAGLRATPGDSRKRVESVVYSVFSAAPDRYGSLEGQAADLACKLAKDHCFPDGNKRTSVLAAMTIMNSYGRALSFTQDDFVSMAMLSAKGDVDGVRGLLLDR